MTGDGTDAEFLHHLDAWVSDASSDEAARTRTRRRHLIEAAEQEATLIASCIGMAERGDTVVVRVASDTAHRGRVLAVGRDFLVLRDGAGSPAFIPFAALTSLRPHPELPMEAPVDAAAPVPSSFASVIAGAGADRPRVQIQSRGSSDALVGELRAVGADVLTLHLDGPNQPRALVPIGSIAALTLLDWR